MVNSSAILRFLSKNRTNDESELNHSKSILIYSLALLYLEELQIKTTDAKELIRILSATSGNQHFKDKRKPEPLQFNPESDRAIQFEKKTASNIFKKMRNELNKNGLSKLKYWIRLVHMSRVRVLPGWTNAEEARFLKTHLGRALHQLATKKIEV